MISDEEVGKIIDYVTKTIPSAEFIDHGEDGVVFKIDEAILKVFAEPERAGRELAGFDAIRAVNKDFAPNVIMFGTMGNYAAILREDIWDAGAHADEMVNEFAHLVSVIAPEVAKQIDAGGNAKTLIDTRFAQFLDDKCIDEDSDIFTKELFTFVIDMIRNGTPVDDFHPEKLGLAAYDGYIRFRDMSRFIRRTPAQMP